MATGIDDVVDADQIALQLDELHEVFLFWNRRYHPLLQLIRIDTYCGVNVIRDAADGVLHLHARLVAVVVIDVIGFVMFQQP